MTTETRESKSAVRAGRYVRAGKRAGKHPYTPTSVAHKAMGRVLYAGHSGDVGNRTEAASREELLEAIRQAALRVVMLEPASGDVKRDSSVLLPISRDIDSDDENLIHQGGPDDQNARYMRLVSVLRRWMKLHNEATHETGQQEQTLVSFLTGASNALNLAPYSPLGDPWLQDVDALQCDMIDVGNDLTIVWAREHAKEPRPGSKKGKASGRAKPTD